MKENATPYKGNSVAMKAVNAGEVEGAVIYHYYWFGDQAKTAGQQERRPVLLQEPGSGRLRQRLRRWCAEVQQEVEAQAFLKWITSKAGQDILKNGTSFEYSVAGDSNAKLVPIADLQARRSKPQARQQRRSSN